MSTQCHESNFPPPLVFFSCSSNFESCMVLVSRNFLTHNVSQMSSMKITEPSLRQTNLIVNMSELKPRQSKLFQMLFLQVISQKYFKIYIYVTHSLTRTHILTNTYIIYLHTSMYVCVCVWREYLYSFVSLSTHPLKLCLKKYLF